jgi:hypothetical protein
VTRAEVEQALAKAIDAESGRGIHWWPGDEMAPLAYRRWVSLSRRNKSKRPTQEERVLDLAKGLQACFEPTVPYTPQSEWLHLAWLLAGVFARCEVAPDG